MTPRIRDVMSSMSLGFVGCLLLISTAVLSTTVAIALSPAARIVSPLSTKSTIP